MISGTAQRVDLYDVVSVLAPGLAFVIGLTPLVPEFIDITSLNLIIPLVILGFVVGRGLHIISIRVEEWFGRQSHRERFIGELSEPDVLNAGVVKRYCRECAEVFDEIGIDESEDDLIETDHQADAIYVLTRSYVHMDGRGRSRSFQAIYAFYRSIWIASVLLGIIYFGYGFAETAGLTQDVLPFQTHLGALGINPGLIALVGVIVSLFARMTFGDAREKYQEYFIQYLISDFLVLETVDYPEAVVAAMDLNEITSE